MKCDGKEPCVVGNGPYYFPAGDEPLLILDGDGYEVCRAATLELRDQIIKALSYAAEKELHP